MICFLARFFIKDYEEVNSPSVRQGYGMLSGAYGIASNILLVIIKLIAGAISGSIAILSDALNNLSDIVSSVVTLIFFKLSGAEADEEHPFGHGRLEYVAGLIVSMLIIIMGVELIQSSFSKIKNPEKINFSPVVIFILVVSIFVKLVMFLSYMQASKAINSLAIRTTAMDSLSDVLSTGIVLLSMLIYGFTGLNIDGFAGLVVACFIIKTGFDSARDTINPLLGEPPDREFIKDIEKTVLSHDVVLGVHDIIVHNYGPSRIIMSLHVEVPADRSLMEVHEAIDEIEKELRHNYHCTAVIHMDPVDILDSRMNEVREWLKDCICRIDPMIRFHDLRISRKNGKKQTLEFDLEVPYKFRIKDKALTGTIKSMIGEKYPEYETEINIDRGDSN